MYQKARFSGAAPTRKHPGARRDSLRLTASRRGPAHRTPPPLAGRPCPCSPSRPSLQSHCVHYLFLHLNTKRFSTGTTQEGLPAGRETHPFTPAFTPAAAPRGTPAHQGGEPCPTPALRGQLHLPDPNRPPRRAQRPRPQSTPRPQDRAGGARESRGVGVGRGRARPRVPAEDSELDRARGAERPCYSPLGATAGRGGPGGGRRAAAAQFLYWKGSSPVSLSRHVRMSASVTAKGSQLAEGRRSSK